MENRKALLFVDDEPEILDILVDLFTDDDYRLYTATRAGEAMEIVNKKDVDFVISDLKLPDATGLSLLDSVKEKNPDTVRVLTSGYLDVAFGCVSEDLKDGTLYLSKPWDVMVLKQLITERLA